MDMIPTDASPKDVPEKYIRTFANDMEAFKKGGTPGLTPFRETPAASSIPEAELTPDPVSDATSALPPLPGEEAGIEIHEEPLADESEPIGSAPTLPPPPPTPTPTPAPSVSVLPPSTTPVTKFHRPDGPAPIHTYSQAFQDRLDKTHASTATVLAAEQDSKTRRTEVTPERARGRWYIALGVFLLLFGGGGTYFAYTKYLVKVAPVILAPTIQTPIFVDNRVTVSGSDEALLQAFAGVIATPIALNTVTAVSFDASTTQITTVFAQLHLSAPDILLRDVEVSNTMAGVVHTQKAQSPFFILSVGSYSTTFSGMLTWEPTMQRSMAELFPLYPAPVVASSTATSTVANTTSPTTTVAPSVFRDETISNHDVRVYRDAAGRSILLYGYWDEHTLIIARDAEAFAEILTRLGTKHS